MPRTLWLSSRIPEPCRGVITIDAVVGSWSSANNSRSGTTRVTWAAAMSSSASMCCSRLRVRARCRLTLRSKSVTENRPRSNTENGSARAGMRSS